MITIKFNSIKDWESYVDLKKELLDLKAQRSDLKQMLADSFKKLQEEVEIKERLELEIAKLERLNIVGQLAAGLGHEVRNPMTTIRGFLQMLQCKKEFLPHKQYFELMIGELDRANAIITDYLSLAKDKPTEITHQCLNKLIENILPLLIADAYSQGKKCLFEPGEIDETYIDQNEITQLILNLARNGLEAMSQDGTLTIKTFTDNQKVVLSVKDEGTGISQDHLAKLGTPFFTTKENGTGLGLTMCYRIAHKHNAQIKIESQSDGTTFLVYFPSFTSQQ